MKIAKKHYTGFSEILSVLTLIALVLGCLYDPGWIVISIFVLPFILLLTIWTIKDKTTLEIRDDMLLVKAVERALSEEWKIHVNNIVNYKVIDQNFSNSGVNTTLTGRPTSKWSTSAGSKKILVVQTKKRVYQIGEKLSEKDVDLLFNFLKENLK